MASVTYYFLFSVIAVMIVILHLVNLVYVNRTGRTFLGEDVKPGASGHKKFSRFSGKIGLVVASSLLIVFVLNLAYCINWMLSLDDREYVSDMLTFGSVAVVLFLAVGLLVMRNKPKN